MGPGAWQHAVSAHFCETMGRKIIQGCDILESDRMLRHRSWGRTGASQKLRYLPKRSAAGCHGSKTAADAGLEGELHRMHFSSTFILGLFCRSRVSLKKLPRLQGQRTPELTRVLKSVRNSGRNVLRESKGWKHFTRRSRTPLLLGKSTCRIMDSSSRSSHAT